MNESKPNSGWNESKPTSGWNESKPSFPIAMNLGEAMAYASKNKCFWTGEMHIALETLAAEVERLRAELAAAKAASEAIVRKLRNEIDHAACNDMRLPPMFGQSKGELAVRVGALQAVIDSTTPPAT